MEAAKVVVVVPFVGPPDGRGMKMQAAPWELVKSKVLAVIDDIRDKYFRNPDKTKICVPTKGYNLFNVHKIKAMFRYCVEHTAGTQPTRRVAAAGVPPPSAVTNPNPFIQCEAGIFISTVAELAAA